MDKVVVGMSGGVDSSVAALLLKEAGYEVIGVTLRNWRLEGSFEDSFSDIDDAKRVADHIGIQHVLIDCFSDFQRYVMDPFSKAYLQGLTPNPCIVCNRCVKWNQLLSYAKSAGAKYVATGHYSSVIQLENGRYTLQTAQHAEKDQTYMLYQLTQEQLAATLMPLSSYSKPEVRELARRAGLMVAAKPDSQEVCFITDGSYGDYIAKTAGGIDQTEGNFVDSMGNVLGKHKGIFRYTIGQRKGLGIALGQPMFVKEIRPDTNEVVLSDDSSLYTCEVVCANLSFMSIPGLEIGESLSCAAKIRYHHAPQSATITQIASDKLRITFEEPVRASTPGQSAVFYDEHARVIGGGIIQKEG